MEHDDRHLDSFSSSMIQYFNEVLIHKNCVSSTFRKYSVKNEEDVEFSFLLNSAIDSNCDDKKSCNQIESTCLTEEIIRLTTDEIDTSRLTEYRLSLIKIATENLLKTGGYKLDDAHGTWIHFTTKNDDKKAKTAKRCNIVCGAVINAATKTKEVQITTDEYRKLRLADIQAMSENKHTDNNSAALELLTYASINMCLLQVKHNQAVTLNFEKECNGPRDTASKGGAFLQYNSSRLAAIRKKYQQRVAEGLYPEIPKYEDVDFAVLKEPEEWGLLFNFLLEYPSLIDRTAKEITKGKTNVHQICNFLSKLCLLFSVYYRRIRILLEPRKHLIPLIHARILLAAAVEQVLVNGMTVLGIERLEEM